MHFKVAVRNFHAFNASRWFPHMLVVTISMQDSGFKNISCCLLGCLMQLVSNTKINQCVFKPDTSRVGVV